MKYVKLRAAIRKTFHDRQDEMLSHALASDGVNLLGGMSGPFRGCRAGKS